MSCQSLDISRQENQDCIQATVFHEAQHHEQEESRSINKHDIYQ